MECSVVVPTLNGRSRLVACLNALSTHAPDAEVVVVNGPSTDGTSGMIHERDDVDVLVEIADRNINVARNAGLAEANGDVIALLDQSHAIEPAWRDSVASAIADGADAVTGPTYRPVRGGVTADAEESRTIAGREVTCVNGGNVALTRETALALDGFDEYLETGGARDAAHRLAGQDRTVTWSSGMGVRGRVETDGGEKTDHHSAGGRLPMLDGEGNRRWGWKYRSLTYRVMKNYGPRPTAVRRAASHAGSDAFASAYSVVRGELTPSEWIGTGWDVVANVVIGAKNGVGSRVRDRTETRNPHGLSVRHDRAVERYDWR